MKIALAVLLAIIPRPCLSRTILRCSLSLLLLLLSLLDLLLAELVHPPSFYVHSQTGHLILLIYDPSVEDTHQYCTYEAVVCPSSLRELTHEHLCGALP